jgi:hypothetical protein
VVVKAWHFRLRKALSRDECDEASLEDEAGAAAAAAGVTLAFELLALGARERLRPPLAGADETDEAAATAAAMAATAAEGLAILSADGIRRAARARETRSRESSAP